jgi:NTE family protein
MADDGGKKRVALVIGSGSVKCAAAIGIQNVLTREGIELDMVVGCSAGSMYAALMASGHSGETAARLTRQLWTRDLTTRRNTRALLAAIAPRVFGFDPATFGLRDDRLINSRLDEVFGRMQIEELPIPLHITATDFSNGELVVLSRGNVATAIRASLAMPFAFAPVRIDGKLLIDGYLADPLPVSVAMKHNAQVIVAVGFESPYQEEIRSPSRFAFQLSSIMSNNLLKSRFGFHSIAHHSEVIAIIPTFTQRIKLFDTEKIDYIIEEGERAAEEQLPYLRELLARQHTAAVRQ